MDLIDSLKPGVKAVRNTTFELLALLEADNETPKTPEYQGKARDIINLDDGVPALPEMRLIRAVVVSAINDLRKYQLRDRYVSRSRAYRTSYFTVDGCYSLAVLWFRTPGFEGFSFESCCEWLDICPVRLIEALERIGLLPRVD